MFGFARKNFFVALFVIASVFLIGMSTALGYNSITSSFDLFVGFGALAGMFGGFLSLVGVVIGLAALCAIFWAFDYMTKTNYAGNEKKRKIHTIVGSLIVIVGFLVMGFVGLNWINFDGGAFAAFGALVVFAVFITVATVIALLPSRTKKVVTDAAPQTVTRVAAARPTSAA